MSVVLVEVPSTRPIEALWNFLVQATSEKPESLLPRPVLPSVSMLPFFPPYAPTDSLPALFVFADLTYVAIPVNIIWGLNMPLVRRVNLMVLMCTSLVTSIVSVLKILTLQTSAAQLAQLEYSFSLAALWAGIEQTLCAHPLRRDYAEVKDIEK